MFGLHPSTTDMFRSVQKSHDTEKLRFVGILVINGGIWQTKGSMRGGEPCLSQGNPARRHLLKITNTNLMLGLPMSVGLWKPYKSILNYVPIHEADVEIFHRINELQ